MDIPTIEEQKTRMLEHLSQACLSCSMCELGLKGAVKNDERRDPHVFSNLTLSRFFMIGQGPGWDELKARKPFVGASGRNLDAELLKNGLIRDDFYITNAVKCWILGNEKPSSRHVARCSPFLQMEINLLHPHFLVTLGAVAFEAVCPDLRYADCLGTFCKSSRYDIKVFPIYHPSPLNMSDAGRKAEFANQISMLSKIMAKLTTPNNNHPAT